MPDTVLSPIMKIIIRSWHCAKHLFLFDGGGAAIIPILQMGKLRQTGTFKNIYSCTYTYICVCATLLPMGHKDSHSNILVNKCNNNNS